MSLHEQSVAGAGEAHDAPQPRKYRVTFNVWSDRARTLRNGKFKRGWVIHTIIATDLDYEAAKALCAERDARFVAAQAARGRRRGMTSPGFAVELTNFLESLTPTARANFAASRRRLKPLAKVGEAV